MAESVEEHHSDEESMELEENEDVDNKNDEYELEREEPEHRTAEQWKSYLLSAEYPEDITDEIKKLKLFKRDPNNGTIVPTESQANLISGFCKYLTSNRKQRRPVLRGISHIFAARDILNYVAVELLKVVVKIPASSASAWWNVFNFLTFVPCPSDRLIPSLYDHLSLTPFSPWNKRRKTTLRNHWERLWLTIMTSTVNSRVALKMIPFLTDHVLSKLKEPFKTADFFFKMFDKGDLFALLSLGAIFRLITQHNFEYPKFYDQVYGLITPSLFHLEQKEQVLNLFDSFLASSHIPLYIVMSFTKKLARCLLYAPVDAIEPTLGLIRNVLTRHASASDLIHRQVASTFTNDPFNEEEKDLSKTGSLETSLWEIRLLQQHWNQNVRKRANFVDKPLQKMESFVRFRGVDELFSGNMGKHFGGETDVGDEYRKSQGGDDDEEEEEDEQPQKQQNKRKGGKFQKKHEEKQVKTVAINHTAPPTKFLDDSTLKYWSL